jgi:hypothetical protein
MQYGYPEADTDAIVQRETLRSGVPVLTFPFVAGARMLTRMHTI